MFDMATKKGNDAPLPCPPPCSGFTVSLPYAVLASPYAVRMKCHIVWIVVNMDCITLGPTPNRLDAIKHTL